MTTARVTGCLRKPDLLIETGEKLVVVAGDLSDSQQSTKTTDTANELQSSHISTDTAHMNLNGWQTKHHHNPLIVLERGNGVTSTNDELQPNLQISGARTRRSLKPENHEPRNPNIDHNTRSMTTRAMTRSQTEARGADRP